MMNSMLLKLHLWITLVTSQIVDRSSVGPSGNFTVRCDIQKFQPEDYPVYAYVNALAIERRSAGEDNFSLMAKFNPFVLVNDHKRLTNVPPSRQWDIKFLGGESDDNRDSIAIVIIVKDANYRDAGLYRCFYIDHLNRKKYTDPFFLRPKAQGRIVSKGTIAHGDELTVQCDMQKFEKKNPPTGTFFNELLAERKTDGDAYYIALARYRPLQDGPDKRESNIPNGRPWEIHFVSGDTDNYRDYSIIIYLEHVTLFDAGRYRCTYLGNGDDRLVNSDPFTVLMKPTQESKIVNKESVGQNETFTVTCDIQKFRETDSPDNNSISTMAAERKLTGEDNYIFMARFTPFAAAEENKRMKNEPAGRQWDVTFSGSETEYNGDTIKIVIDVVDGSSADVGLYRCSYTDAEAALHYSDSVYLRSNDTLENQIVNKNSVGENDMLVIVCDIQKFQPEDYPDFAYINALSAEWKPVGQDDFLEIAVFSPFGHDESTKYVTNIPAGRNWSVDYIGANNDFNRDSIKIVIVKEDADYSDAGMYRCNYKNYKNTFYSETQRLLVKPNKPRLNLDIVKHVNNFTVECEIRRFSQKSDFLGNHAGIERKLEAASQYSVIRLFSIYGNKTTESTMIAPPGRSWGGGSKYGDNINIYVEMRDVDCYDAGLYRCISIEDQLTVYSEPVQLKSQETFQQDSIKIVLSVGLRAASLELQEKTDFNVNCTFLGPTTLKSSWTFKERGILNMDHKYTIADLPTTKVLDTRNCLATLHTSQLTYQYESEKDEWTFVCSVFDDKGRLFKSAILPVTVQKKVTDNNNLSLPVTDNNKEGVKEKTTASSDYKEEKIIFPSMDLSDSQNATFWRIRFYVLSNYGPWSEWACGRNCKDTNMYRKRECDLNMACQGQKEESLPADCYTKGICPSDCYVGRWGVGCTSTCHNCLKDCDKFTGFCDRCKNGYFDPQLSCNSSKIQFLSNPVPTEGESVRFVCTAAVLDAVPKDTTCVNMVQVFYYNITLRNNSVLAVYQRTDTNNIFQLKDMNWLVTTSGINYTENDKCMNLFTATIALRTSNVQVKDSGSYICSILTSTEQWLYQGATLSVQPLSKLSKTSSFEKTTQRAWFRSKATRTESPTLDVIKIILILVYFIKTM